MRPIERGEAPQEYIQYQDARDELADRIGWYCSYCEMGVKNMIEVEHVEPQSKVEAKKLSWDNLFLSCKYCNTVKGARNVNREGYLWPDRDNTDLAFQYSEKQVCEPRDTLEDQEIIDAAKATINLMGLDRRPGGKIEPIPKDTRWVSREEVWYLAKESLNEWREAPTSGMAAQIGRTSKIGHYSIWCTVFAEVPEVLREIRKNFKGTNFDYDDDGKRKKRPEGLI